MTKPNSELTQEQIDKNNAYSRRRYETKRLADLARKKRVREERLAYLYSIHTNSCADCDIVETELGFFDFHHIDPSKKEGSISSMLSSANMDRVLNELQKCVMLCPNCHRRRHMATGHYGRAKETEEI